MVKILDCTIRDGGYANNWEFSDECFLQTFITAQKSQIDYFETGYRNKSGTDKFSCITDEYLKFLDEYKTGCTKLLVMVNEKEYDPSLFTNAVNSPIDGVRVACHVPEIDVGIKVVEDLHLKGYEVFLNIMNIPQIQEKHFDKIRQWKDKDILVSICFADSYGVLMPENIPVYFKKFREAGFTNISLHTHNNLQMAFANTLAAINCGAYCVDGTVYGMGRGGGNLPLELLIGYLKEHSAEYYLELIEKYYLPIYKKYDWGYSVPSLISALKNIHPNLTRDSNLSYKELWNKYN